MPDDTETEATSAQTGIGVLTPLGRPLRQINTRTVPFAKPLRDRPSGGTGPVWRTTSHPRWRWQRIVKADMIALLCQTLAVALSLGWNLVIFKASERQRVRDQRPVSSGCTSVRRQLVLGVVGRFA